MSLWQLCVRFWLHFFALSVGAPPLGAALLSLTPSLDPQVLSTGLLLFHQLAAGVPGPVSTPLRLGVLERDAAAGERLRFHFVFNK